MADFQNKFTISKSSDQKSLVMVSTTGDYTLSNPGYGAPNPTRAQITTDTLQITLPDPNTYQLSTSTITLDLLADYGYPVIETITIPNTAFGLSATATLPDGGYLFSENEQSTETGDDATYEQELVLTGNTQCCLDRLSSELMDCGCSSSAKQAKQVNLIKANMALASIQFSSCNQEKALNALAFAAEVCASSNCSGC